ncbi:thioredoxin family protein [Kribbella sp. WER1]
MKNVTDREFGAVILESGGPVVVDFWADWCDHCEQVAAALEVLAAENTGLIFVRLNVDDNPAAPAFYGVVNLPTVNVYINGELAKSITGPLPEPALRRELQPFTDIPA